MLTLIILPELGFACSFCFNLPRMAEGSSLWQREPDRSSCQRKKLTITHVRSVIILNKFPESFRTPSSPVLFIQPRKQAPQTFPKRVYVPRMLCWVEGLEGSVGSASAGQSAPDKAGLVRGLAPSFLPAEKLCQASAVLTTLRQDT